MTTNLSVRSALASMVLLGSATMASAGVIYSSLRDIGIPTTFDGVYLDLDSGLASFNETAGWDINPVFGGSVVASSPAFLPVRTASGNESPLLALSVGDLVNGSLTFSSGYGGSMSHLGSNPGQFAAGQESFMGFKFTPTGGGGPYFGWMRVVFTNNTGGALIRDWAYENDGSAISTGRVLQAPTVGYVSPMTLSGGSGESPSLASVIANPTGGAVTTLTKQGAGSWTLTAANTFTGATTVSAGTLTANATAGALQNTATVQMTGGTLLLGASDQINNTAAITLDGHSLGSVALGTGGFAEQVGVLTLSSNSVIDLGTLNAGNALRFAASASATWAGTLSIWNWSGLAGGGGADQVFFGSDVNGLTSTQLGQIQFVNPAGFDAGIYGASLLSSGSLVPSGLIAPVPEPATIVGAAALLGLAVFRGRRRVVSAV